VPDDRLDNGEAPINIDQVRSVAAYRSADRFAVSDSVRRCALSVIVADRFRLIAGGDRNNMSDWPPPAGTSMQSGVVMYAAAGVRDAAGFGAER
jgi:hypothetical protein